MQRQRTEARDRRQAIWHEFPQRIRPRHPPAADAVFQFGRFRVLLRQRRLLADDVPIELGTRAFDVLLVLLKADGLLVTKDELLSQAWPGVVVSEDNLKVQISALRKALGTDRDFVRTEFGRGYRFTGELRSNVALDRCCGATGSNSRSGRALFRQTCRRSLGGWCGSSWS
jgi:DNA-binding winged helix-turn-helix (wHTH) protein